MGVSEVWLLERQTRDALSKSSHPTPQARTEDLQKREGGGGKGRLNIQSYCGSRKVNKVVTDLVTSSYRAGPPH